MTERGYVPIYRLCNNFSDQAMVWSTSVVEDGLFAAPLHEMVIPIHPVERLNELTEKEEAGYWSYIKSRVKVISAQKEFAGVVILVNDGASAGQTVGTLNAHIIGVRHHMSSIDLAHEFETCTDLFFSGVHPKPYAEHHFDLSESSLLKMRKLRLQSQKEDRNIGYSVFIRFPFQYGGVILDEKSMVLQSWLSTKPRKYGLTNLMRVINGYRERPYDWPAENLNRKFVIGS